MTRYILSNMDFEYELSGQARNRAQVQQRLKPWSSMLRLVEGFEQAQQLTNQRILDEDEVLYWGLAPSARKFIPTHVPLPSPEAVFAANDKRTSAALEHELGIALEGSALLSTLDQALSWIEARTQPWVIKHPFGVSGRDRLRGQGPELNDPSLGWLKKQLSSPQLALIAEPWVELQEERSTQLHLHEDGRLTMLGVTTLLCDNTGVWRGHIVPPIGQQAAPLQTEAQLHAIAQRLHSLGYFGPLGLDAFIAQPPTGLPQLRPLVEINARHTFGRLALELRRFTQPQLWLAWWQPSQSATRATKDTTPLSLDCAEPGIYRLPSCADPDGEAGIFVILGEDRAQLSASLATLQG